MNMFYSIFFCLVSIAFTFEIYENADVCVDSCDSNFQTTFTINLKTGKYDSLDNYFVQFVDHELDRPSEECDKNAVIRIPMFDLEQDTIVKIELNYDNIFKGLNLHIGNSPSNDINGGDLNSTINNAQFFTNNSDLFVYKSSRSSCDNSDATLLYNQTEGFLYPKQKLIIFIANKWIRIDNLETNQSSIFKGDDLFRFHFDQSSENGNCGYFERKSYLYIGLNRAIDDKLQVGKGLCEAKISFINCYSNEEPNIDVDIRGMSFKNNDNDSIEWINELRYLEPTPEHPPCSGEGVLRLKFEPTGSKKIARFDLELGNIISGFTFNIGDSPTNNGYGGDSGTTSNSAEIHSNDNRFYVWLNPKYCGDTLLHKIEYGIFSPNDLLTMFVSDQRLEITNNRDYREIFKNPHLYNLNDQNVSCNCFDTRCYPGALPENDVYFGINRVIGGSYRPGVGLCRTRVTWLECKKNVRKPSVKILTEITDKPISMVTESTIETTELVTSKPITTTTTTTSTSTTEDSTTTITTITTSTSLPTTATTTKINFISSTTIELTSKQLKIADDSLKTLETATTKTSDEKYHSSTSTLLTEQHEKLTISSTTTVINQTEALITN